MHSEAEPLVRQSVELDLYDYPARCGNDECSNDGDSYYGFGRVITSEAFCSLKCWLERGE